MKTETLPYILTLVVAIAGVAVYKIYFEEDVPLPQPPVTAVITPEELEPEATESSSGTSAHAAAKAAGAKTAAEKAAAEKAAAEKAAAAKAAAAKAAAAKAAAAKAAAASAAASGEPKVLPLRPLTAAQLRHLEAEKQCAEARDYLLQNNYTQALKLYQQALPVFEKEEGKSANTASIYNNIGEIYRNQHKYNEALKWHQKALAIREKVLGTNHPDTGESYNNIALIQTARGNYDKALDGYQKDLAIEQAHGNDNPEIATTYGNIGTTHFKHGEYTQALEWYQKAYKILLPTLGEAHAQTKATRIDMEAAYKKTKNPKPFAEWLAETQS
jgi:tetratricopeptide (TPR) repeat protein